MRPGAFVAPAAAPRGKFKAREPRGSCGKEQTMHAALERPALSNCYFYVSHYFKKTQPSAEAHLGRSVRSNCLRVKTDPNGSREAYAADPTVDTFTGTLMSPSRRQVARLRLTVASSPVFTLLPTSVRQHADCSEDEVCVVPPQQGSGAAQSRQGVRSPEGHLPTENSQMGSLWLCPRETPARSRGNALGAESQAEPGQSQGHGEFQGTRVNHVNQKASGSRCHVQTQTQGVSSAGDPGR